METAGLACFTIDEGLDSEADAVDADTDEGGQGLIGKLTGGALDGDLSVRIDGEAGVDGGEELVDEVGFEQAWGAAAEIDGVDGSGQVRAEGFAPLASLVHLGDEALD